LARIDLMGEACRSGYLPRVLPDATSFLVGARPRNCSIS